MKKSSFTLKRPTSYNLELFYESKHNISECSACILSEQMFQINQIKSWCMMLIPSDLQTDLHIEITENKRQNVVFNLTWCVCTVCKCNNRGSFVIATKLENVNQQLVIHHFPDYYTLTQWRAGNTNVKWPPVPTKKLRFKVGDRVECKVNAKSCKGWMPGRVIKLNYTEIEWAPNTIVPYQAALHSGRLIFAPEDSDCVIRARPVAEPDAPSSPEWKSLWHIEENDE